MKDKIATRFERHFPDVATDFVGSSDHVGLDSSRAAREMHGKT